MQAGELAMFATSASLGGGVIAGSVETNSGTFAWRMSGSTIERLPELPGGAIIGKGNAISHDGSVIVGSSDRTLGHQAVRWDNGTISALPDLPGGRVFGAAEGVSGNGHVAVGSGTPASQFRVACRWVGSTVESLGILTGATATDSFASDANFDGTVVVGGSSAPSSLMQAFMWQDGEMVGLGYLQNENSVATAITSDASLIVGWTFGSHQEEVFIWDAQRGMRDLATVLSQDYGLNFQGLRLTEVTGISDDGTVIVGNGITSGGNSRGWIAVIPAPGALALLGLGGLAIARRRR
jgi:MYXO-CTERM domain-containing protein